MLSIRQNALNTLKNKPLQPLQPDYLSEKAHSEKAEHLSSFVPIIYRKPTAKAVSLTGLKVVSYCNKMFCELVRSLA